MQEYINFVDFYSLCISIIENYNIHLKELSTFAKIKYIRENENRNILNSYFCIGRISQETANAISSATTLIKFSADSMIKNILEHPEITYAEYTNISIYLSNAEYILRKNDKTLIYFKLDNKIYQFVIKNTKNGNELYITTFHKASFRQLTKDVSRYLRIKKDNFDYEDSKYPSVT